MHGSLLVMQLPDMYDAGNYRKSHHQTNGYGGSVGGWCLCKKQEAFCNLAPHDLLEQQGGLAVVSKSFVLRTVQCNYLTSVVCGVPRVMAMRDITHRLSGIVDQGNEHANISGGELPSTDRQWHCD